MKKLLITGVALAALAMSTPALANPPENGYTGPIVYENGKEPIRFACDTLALIKTIYEVGKDKPSLMRPKFIELNLVSGVHGDPQCVVGTYGAVKVVEESVFLGPLENPFGDIKLFCWAVHVSDKPKKGPADYWILYLDTKDEHPWLQVGTSL